MSNTTLPLEDEIQERLKQNLIRSLCTEFPELTINDLGELIEQNPTTAPILQSITIGDLMDFEEASGALNGHAKQNGARASKQKEADAEVLARVARLKRPSLEMATVKYDLEVLRFVQAARQISQALLAHALHDPKSQSTKRRTYIRVQRAAKRLAEQGEIESFKQGSVVYHRALK